jgi:hypothetical protein
MFCIVDAGFDFGHKMQQLLAVLGMRIGFRRVNFAADRQQH